MATEVIVLSSPGETEHRQKHEDLDQEKIFGPSPSRFDATDLPSPSELFRAPRRSKYFAVEKSKSDKQPPGRTPKIATTAKDGDIGTAIDAKEASAIEKPRPRSKKPVKGNKVAQSSTAEGGQSQKAAPAKKPRKPSTRKTTQTGEAQNKTLVGRVGKPSAAQAKNSAKKAAPSVCQEPPVESGQVKEKFDWDKDELNLEEAVKRRLDWTPTREKSRADGGTESSLNSHNRRSFGSLLSEYGFNGSAIPVQTRKSSNEAPTKRRRIENGNDAATMREATPGPQIESKAKDGRKKPSTLTGRVTACYITSVSETRTTNALMSLSDTEHCSEDAEKSKPPRRGKVKVRQKTKPVEYRVLAPEAAVESLEQQELMFGTCSQLEREDSPTTLQNVQLAINASEECTTDTQSSRSEQSLMAETASAAWKSRFASPRKLWHVAARDGTGDLVQGGVVDLVDLTESPQTSTSQIHKEHMAKASAPVTTKDNADAASELDPCVPQIGQNGERHTPVIEQCSVAEVVSTTMGSSTAEGSLEQATQPKFPKMPDYGAFTDARLKAQITKFGFKQVKSRKKMIELLTQCWEAKHARSHAQTASEAKSTTANAARNGQPGAPANELTCSVHATSRVEAPATGAWTVSSTSQGTLRQSSQQLVPSTGTKSGRTAEQRDSAPTSSFKDIDEIEDSEEELIPSPNRIQRQYALPRRAAKCQPLQISPVPISHSATKDVATDSSSKSYSATLCQPDAALPDMALQITKAVRAQPRLHRGLGRQKISWHEKILMYDPIVLEDFATWLNTEGLALVDEDREVSAGFVREWCENKGICCCWKRNELMS